MQPQPPQQQPHRSRLRSATSLVALLMALQGRAVQLELRNDVLISGRLASVDEHMNVWVDDAVWQPVQGPGKMYPLLFVRGKTLRMVHLPSGLDAAATLEQHIGRVKKQRVAAALDMINSRHERLAKGVADGAQPGHEQAAGSSVAAAAAGGDDGDSDSG